MSDIMTQNRVRLPSIRELEVGIPALAQQQVLQQQESPAYTHKAASISISPVSSPANSRQGSLSNGLQNFPVAMLPPMQQAPTSYPSPSGYAPLPLMSAPIIPVGMSRASPRHQQLQHGVPLPVQHQPHLVHQHQLQHQFHQEHEQHQHQQQQQLHQQHIQVVQDQGNAYDKAMQQPKKKRPRRKANEMVRLYACNYKNCKNSYGTLNHLNAHVTFKRHGPKRKPEEFKQIRELFKLKKKLGTVDTMSPKELEEVKASGDEKRTSLAVEELKKEENIKLLADLSGKMIENEKQATEAAGELPIFHQQRGYNGYGRYDHTLTSNDLEKITN